MTALNEYGRFSRFSISVDEENYPHSIETAYPYIRQYITPTSPIQTSLSGHSGAGVMVNVESPSKPPSGYEPLPTADPSLSKEKYEDDYEAPSPISKRRTFARHLLVRLSAILGLVSAVVCGRYLWHAWVSTDSVFRTSSVYFVTAPTANITYSSIVPSVTTSKISTRMAT